LSHRMRSRSSTHPPRSTGATRWSTPRTRRGAAQHPPPTRRRVAACRPSAITHP
jgi:hypothetical protein